MMHTGISKSCGSCCYMLIAVKLIGDRCDPSASCCFCHEYVTHSECVENVCRCQTGYRRNDVGNRCLPIDTGDTTTTDSAVVGRPRPATAESDVGLRQPVFPTTDFAAEVALVAAGVVVICLLAFVDAFLLVWLFKAFVFGKPPPSNCRQLFDVMGCWRPHTVVDANFVRAHAPCRTFLTAIKDGHMFTEVWTGAHEHSPSTRVNGTWTRVV